MSLFGAMSTAISGLNAQSAAFGNISDNVANSQTVGFKRVDTSFQDYLTSSTAARNDSGSVAARPDYANNVQGTITQTDNPLALAISGSGFFAVAEKAGVSTSGTPVFSATQYYTRAGDFSMDKDGYLVNSAGETLEGWPINPATGGPDTTTLTPIQISQAASAPQATSKVTLSANLPASPTAGSTIASQVSVYDSLGALHTVTLNWTQTSTDNWTVSVTAPDAKTPSIGTANVSFGSNGVPAGTVGDITGATGSVTASGYSAGGQATLGLTLDFGQGPQTVSLNLGAYGQSTGLTQYAGTDYSLRGVTQDGVPPGAFNGVTIKSNGDVVVNYDNGQSRTVARVPIITFASPDSLQRQDGQAFTATTESGAATISNAGSNGSGGLATQAVESSNVDIAQEFSQLIVAQRAYSANAKMVTTADDMLQQTIDMKR